MNDFFEDIFDDIIDPELFDDVDGKEMFRKKYGKVKIQDHLGNEFSSEEEMCRYWNIDRDLFRRRRNPSGFLNCRNRWSLEEALTIPAGGRRFGCKDHEGNRFNNYREMCKHWDIPLDVYSQRKSKGWSLQFILTTPITTREMGCKDHLGKKFASQKEMCEHYGISPECYKSRINAGCDVKTALTTETHGSYLEMSVREYLKSKNIKFETEYTFSDCRFDVTGFPARFDFYIQSVGIIEVDGAQHFNIVERFGGEDGFRRNIIHDAIKTAYCEEHNIPLLRIHYKQMQDGTYIDLIEDFIANPEAYIKQHNKFLSEEEYYAERTENLSVASA